ncbi:hypothetical protein F4803DRAFT_544475 [Xylaria telfairii]|nr:hypothetical protein F4803DRAFT_544475 [Xylaria telfairii]
MSKEPIVYHLKPTKLIPNSHYTLLHYKGMFPVVDGKADTGAVFDRFVSNGWETQWVARYGPSQPSHYHPEAHECMAVITGPGIIRFGVADLDEDWKKNTYGAAYEDDGILLLAEAGDAFIIPSGVAHKSFDPTPGASHAVLTGDAHSVDGDDPRAAVKAALVSGFTMMGAYPNGYKWTWAEGGHHEGTYEKVWSVPKPKCDPFVGEDGGLLEHWKGPSAIDTYRALQENSPKI